MAEKKAGSRLIETAERLSSPDEFESVVESLRKSSGSELRDAFAAMLADPDAALALGIARAIGDLRTVEAIDLLSALVSEPGKWFTHSERSEIQRAAVESLGKTSDPRSIEALVDVLKQSHDLELELEAVKAIGLIGHESAVRPLLEEMVAHPPLALSAAGAVAQIGGEEALGGLIACLGHKDEMVRSASVWALGKLGDERAIGPLVNLARDADPFSRLDIAWAIGRIGGEIGRTALEVIAASDADERVRREASRALESPWPSGNGHIESSCD